MINDIWILRIDKLDQLLVKLLLLLACNYQYHIARKLANKNSVESKSHDFILSLEPNVIGGQQ